VTVMANAGRWLPAGSAVHAAVDRWLDSRAKELRPTIRPGPEVRQKSGSPPDMTGSDRVIQGGCERPNLAVDLLLRRSGGR
jgi:hypothetical protein